MMLENFLILSGFVLGLGAVTVIDLHGFLGQKSSYWTEATTRTHKITKPLIWAGTLLYLLGATLKYSQVNTFLALPVMVMCFLMVLNGTFLSFVISPFLLKREKEGKSSELLPTGIQTKIKISFVVSFLLWWSQVAIFVYSIS